MGDLPHDLEAERVVLGALYLDATTLAEIDGLVSADDFYAPKHAAIFVAMQTVAARGEPLDAVTIGAELRAQSQLQAAGGAGYLADLGDAAVTTAFAARHARIVREHAETRRLVLSLRELCAAACEGKRRDEVADTIQRIALSLSSRHGESEPTQVRDMLERHFERIEERAKGLPPPGIRTGFAALDAVMNPMAPGHLIIVAGRPSMGKTSLVTRIAVNASAAGKPTLFFSLETKNDSLIDRTQCMEAAVDLRDATVAKLNQHEFEKLVASAQRLHQLPLWFDDGFDLSLATLRRKAMRHKQRHGLGLVVIDYLQLMRPERGNASREREVSDLSRGVKLLAKELDVPIILLSQLSRGPEGRTVKDHRPRLSDLRDSGAIEQDADVVAFVYRDVVYNPSARHDEAEVIVAKQKNGPTDTATLRFVRHATRFEDMPDEQAAAVPNWSDMEQFDAAQ